MHEPYFIINKDICLCCEILILAKQCIESVLGFIFKESEAASEGEPDENAPCCCSERKSELYSVYLEQCSI